MEPTGLAVLVVAVLAATAVGLWRASTDGLVREVATEPGPAPAPALGPADLGGPLGGHATLVQFSSAFCAPCRATRALLSQVATSADGVRHVEIDAESRLDLVRRLGVTRTPTVLVLDATGRVVRRAVGAPSRQAVLSALEAATGGRP